MSKFMDFLDNIDDDIINETYVDEPVKERPVVKKKTKVVPKKTVKKDSSVKLIEARIRTKLDSIGLNESAIGDVVSFVLDDVQKVANIKSKTQQPKPKTTPKPKQVQENNRMNTTMGRAESLLEGLPDTMGSLSSSDDSGETVSESKNLSDVASHASSLL